MHDLANSDSVLLSNAHTNRQLPLGHRALLLLLLTVGACSSSSALREGSTSTPVTRSAAPAQSAECAAVADSVRASVPEDRLPRAISDHRLRYPTPPLDAAVGVPVETFAIVSPDGRIDSTTFRVAGTGDVAYKRAMLRTVSSARWRPAKVGECSVWSRIGIEVTNLGITR
jgi:hypothetical protein